MQVIPIDHAELPPFTMPARFRTDIAYFMTPAGEHGVPKLPSGEYWIRLEESREWLADGVYNLEVEPFGNAKAMPAPALPGVLRFICAWPLRSILSLLFVII